MSSLKRFIKRLYFPIYLKRRSAPTEPPTPLHFGNEVDGYIETLNTEGIVVLPNLFSSEALETLKEESDRIKIKRHTLQNVMEDEDSFRIHRIDQHSHIIRDSFTDHPLLTQIVHGYYAKEPRERFTMYQESFPSNVDRFTRRFGLSGFHFDNLQRRLKAFIYLEDVALENGPFTYIKGSQDPHSFNKYTKMQKHYIEGSDTAESYDHSYYSKAEEEALGLWDKATPMIAPAGTVIIAETRGLHVAAPITKGTRRVLVNYY